MAKTTYYRHQASLSLHEAVVHGCILGAIFDDNSHAFAA